MKITIVAAALSLALTSGAALAQPGWFDEDPVGPVPRAQIMAAVRSVGLRPISPPMRRGHTFVVNAIDAEGDISRVVVDAEFGDVIRITATRPRVPVYRDRWGPPRRWWDGEVAVARPPARVGHWRSHNRNTDEGLRATLSRRAMPEVDSRGRPKPSKPPASARHSEPHTAAVRPAQQLPTPRARPKIPDGAMQAHPPAKPAEKEQASTGAPATAKPAPAISPAEGAKQTPAPRIILEGGPTPKPEHSAAETSARNASEVAPRSDKQPDTRRQPEISNKPDAGAAKLPPVQPLE